MKPFMKKFLSLVLACACIFCTTACGDDDETSGLDSNTPPISCTHSYASATTKQATCKETGIKTYTCTLCGNTYMEDIAKLTTHSYTSEVTKEATCKEAGIKTYTCGVCGDSYTEDIAQVANHSYTSEITKEATCKEAGVKTYTCGVCGDSYTEDIAKLTTHSYETDIFGNVLTSTVKEATCKTEGIISRTCTICGPVEENTSKIEHDFTQNNICYMCGLNCPITLNMTNEQKTIASEVTKCSVKQYGTINGILIGLVLKTDTSNSVLIPAVVDIVITNNQNKIVYSCLKEVTCGEFITNSDGDYEYRININHTDLSNIEYAIKSIEISIVNPEYFGFKPSIYVPPAIIITNEILPRIITDAYSNGEICTKVTITNIKYGWSGSTPRLLFSGEKIYDIKGENYSQSCAVGYKLYDMDDNLVESGTYYTESLAMGETFKNDVESLYGLKHGGFYRLEILNVG